MKWGWYIVGVICAVIGGAAMLISAYFNERKDDNDKDWKET